MNDGGKLPLAITEAPLKVKIFICLAHCYYLQHLAHCLLRTQWTLKHLLNE